MADYVKLPTPVASSCSLRFILNRQESVVHYSWNSREERWYFGMEYGDRKVNGIKLLGDFPVNVSNFKLDGVLIQTISLDTVNFTPTYEGMLSGTEYLLAEVR